MQTALPSWGLVLMVPVWNENAIWYLSFVIYLYFLPNKFHFLQILNKIYFSKPKINVWATIYTYIYIFFLKAECNEIKGGREDEKVKHSETKVIWEIIGIWSSYNLSSKWGYHWKWIAVLLIIMSGQQA